jgi:hypothetical protein
MTLVTQSAKPVVAQLDRCPPALKTERLLLRAPSRGDGKAIVRLVNDRRIAENTARIPHPYFLDDAETFIAAANRQAGEATFAILCDDALIGMCGVEPRQDGPEIGYWLGVPFWGHGYATEKCGFQWTGVGLYRIRAINSSAPLDRFRLDRGLWASLKAWGHAREVA